MAALYGSSIDSAAVQSQHTRLLCSMKGMRTETRRLRGLLWEQPCVLASNSVTVCVHECVEQLDSSCEHRSAVCLL